MSPNILLQAAVMGILAGVGGSKQVDAHASGLQDGSVLQTPDPAKHACKGQNPCKGLGGCKTDKNDCKGRNQCKGKGGCRTDGKSAR
jgi:hypothetical protein